MNQVLICRSAFAAIKKESRKYRQRETGGILIGCFGIHTIVLSAGAGGVDAVRLPGLFKNDAAQDKRLLDAARQEFGESAQNLGGWHLHPSGMPEWSCQDQRQAQELLSEFGDGRPVFVGITTRIRLGTTLKLFLYQLTDPAGQLEPVPFEVIDDADKRVLDSLETSPVVPKEDLETTFFEDPKFQFYETRVGRKRIQNEIRSLREGGSRVLSFRRKESHNLVIAVVREKRVLFECPPEYPLNAPQAIVDGFEVFNVPELIQWNSTRKLVDVLNAIVGDGNNNLLTTDDTLVL